MLIILYRKIFAEIYTERKGEVMGSLDLILTAAALIVGVMLLTGHGEIFIISIRADHQGCWEHLFSHHTESHIYPNTPNPEALHIFYC